MASSWSGWLSRGVRGGGGAGLGAGLPLALRLYPAAPGVLQAVLGAGVYPALAVLLTRAHQTLAEPELA